MRVAVGDNIRADMGGNMFAAGVVVSLAPGKIRVRLPSDRIIEVELRGNHTINGRKLGEGNPYQRMLKELDNATGLTEWEKEFVGDLIQTGQKFFSPKQEEMIYRVYHRRVENA